MIGLFFWFCIAAIVYTYAGYPLLLALLARQKGKPRPYERFTLPVTLLIAAYNEEGFIADKLENSLSLDYAPERLQILVAADGSDDSTCAIVRAYASRGVELSYSPARHGKMAAINRAMRRAQGEIIVFSDANNLYGRNALLELVAPFADPTVGAVTGAKRVQRGDGALGESDGLYWKYESFIKEQETRLSSATGVSGEIFAIRRCLFEAPPDNIINDDFFIAMRLIRRGYRMVYVPQAHSYERISASALDEIQRRSRIIAGRYQAIMLAPQILSLRQPRIIWQVVSHKFLRPLVPLAMLGALFSNLVAVARPRRHGRAWFNLAPPWGRILLALQAFFYTLAIIGNQMEGKPKDGTLPFYIYLPTFLVNSNSAALIGLYRFLTSRQSTRWQRVRRREDAEHDGVDGQRI